MLMYIKMFFFNWEWF